MGGKNSKQAQINAKLKAKEWQWQLKTEVKHMDREIKKIQAGEAKMQAEIRKQADAGHVDSVQMLAKSVVKSRKAVARLEKTKANMHAVDLQLTTSIATMSTASALKLSAECMAKMNRIACMPEVGDTMKTMQAEMAKCAEADDKIEAAFQEEGEEDAAAIEVQKVLEEMALEKMGPLAAAAAVPTALAPAAPAAASVPPSRQLIAEGVEAAPPRPAAAPQAPAAAPPASVAAPADAAAATTASPAPAPPPAAQAEVGAEEDELMRRLQNLKNM